MARLRSSDVRGFEEGAALARIRRAISEPREILNAIGALIVKESGKAFRLERLGPWRWKNRDETKMNPNWPGLIRDAMLGRSSPPMERFRAGPVLQDTGLLARSVNHQVISSDTVEAGVGGPAKRYADPLHAGGPSQTETVTETVQRRIGEWMKRARRAVRNLGKALRRRGTRSAAASDAALHAAIATRSAIRSRYPKGAKIARSDRIALGKANATIRERKAAAARAAPATPTARESARGARAQIVKEGLSKVGWLMNKKFRGRSFTIKHPPRPIVGIPPDLVREVEKTIGVKIRVAR